MVRAPVLAAGGIVLRQEATPLIAVVRLRKRNEWVLPKGKLDDGETARGAAEREVLEETGHAVSVHEFLGTLVCESGGRSKVVHYWRMEANGGQIYDLMDDVKAVAWLPLDSAVERLSRGYERVFLANVGPLALEAAALAEAARRPRPKQSVLEKRQSLTVARRASLTKPVSVPLQGDLTSTEIEADERRLVANDTVEAERSGATPFVKANVAAPSVEFETGQYDTPGPTLGWCKSLIRKVREWSGRRGI